MDRVVRLASQRAVVIFSTSSCYMCHTIKAFFQDLGVNCAVYELDEDPQGRDMERALARLLGRSPPVPAVFIGGKMIGSTDRVMSLHLSGDRTPLLSPSPSLSSPPTSLSTFGGQLRLVGEVLVFVVVVVCEEQGLNEKELPATRCNHNGILDSVVTLFKVHMRSTPPREEGVTAQ
ncbi:hypothetical protein Taro_029384 [Colocasia esculenta]|uniref:Glutaredoxin domain-containing protein n=1 Tax=Colocasia esculenta TaxID=4460 RepID=A0A843VT39_COLES|nr:hypothetical protein [Colocasia esculenta]